MKRQRELDAWTRAHLFAQLAQAERGGVPVLQALKIVTGSANASLQQRLSLMRSFASSGMDIARAGLRSGLFLAWETRLLHAAMTSGKLAQSYAGLSQRHADRARRVSRIKGSLVLPFAVLIVAVFVAPLPALFRGEISGASYLLITAGRLGLLFLALFLLSAAWSQLGRTGADNTLFRLLLRVPFAGRIIRRQQRRDFLLSLVLLLEAGVAAFEALALAADSVSHPDMRKRFSTSVHRAKEGATLTQALVACGALQDSTAEKLLRTGEFAGRTDEMIRHHIRQLEEQLDAQFATLVEWTPRGVYILVVLFFVMGR